MRPYRETLEKLAAFLCATAVLQFNRQNAPYLASANFHPYIPFAKAPKSIFKYQHSFQEGNSLF